MLGHPKPFQQAGRLTATGFVPEGRSTQRLMADKVVRLRRDALEGKLDVVRQVGGVVGLPLVHNGRRSVAGNATREAGARSRTAYRRDAGRSTAAAGYAAAGVPASRRFRLPHTLGHRWLSLHEDHTRSECNDRAACADSSKVS